MSCRFCLFLLCLLLIGPPANALCHWAVEVTPPPGVPPCSGYQDSRQQPWPRLPTDTEIGSAKEEYLSYLLAEEGDERRRIDSVQMVKFHTCEGTWVNHVDMEVKYSWWWESISGEGEWQPSVAYTFLIYDPGRDRFEFVLDIGVSPYFLGFITNAVQGFATGSCSSGGGTVSPPASGGSASPDSDDTSWIVIIGAIAIIGGGLAIGAKKLAGGKKEKPSEEKKKKKEPEKVRYILQLSADHLTVTPDSAAPLKVTAWKIVGERPPAPAPEAAITLTIPAGNEGLSLRPASGAGSVEASIALISQVAQSPVPITVTASAGKSSVTSQVMVEIPAEYVMEFF
jgi:hypothetical protein